MGRELSTIVKIQSAIGQQGRNERILKGNQTLNAKSIYSLQKPGQASPPIFFTQPDEPSKPTRVDISPPEQSLQVAYLKLTMGKL